MRFKNVLYLCFGILIVFALAGAYAIWNIEPEMVVDLGEEKAPSATLPKIDMTGPEVIKFGFDLRSSSTEDARQYLPFLKYLERATGYAFQLRFTPKNGNIADDLGKGLVHLAAIGSVSFVQANQKYGIIPLVRGLNHKNADTYRSILVVAPGSKIASVAELRGNRLAFGNRDSTQGHLIPRIILNKQGIKLDDLKGFEYMGSHQNCANAVITGQTDVCGMQDTMARRLASENKLKILHISEPYPSSGVAAVKSLPKPLIEKLRKALLDFQPTGRDRKGLYNWDQTEMPAGFVVAHKEDYLNMSIYMKDLGFLE